MAGLSAGRAFNLAVALTQARPLSLILRQVEGRLSLCKVYRLKSRVHALTSEQQELDRHEQLKIYSEEQLQAERKVRPLSAQSPPDLRQFAP